MSVLYGYTLNGVGMSELRKVGDNYVFQINEWSYMLMPVAGGLRVFFKTNAEQTKWAPGRFLMASSENMQKVAENYYDSFAT